MKDPLRQCQHCGMELPPLSVQGLCPRCVLEAGLKVLEPTRAGDADPHPTSISPVPSFPCTPFTAERIQYFGDYEILEEIARGGMGVVLKARQVSLNRIVALKLMSAGALATAELVQRFKAEAEAAAGLSHPNIVPIHEIGEHQGQQYFSMGYVDGPNLREVVRDRHAGRVDLPQTADWMIKIARATHYAHQRGVLHRDIKPSNILMDAQGEPHLTDFGLAKLVEKGSTLTHTNAILGTPSYMSPEQARGDTKEVTTSADVYGLGAVLYESLTGSPPFAGGTSLETIRKVLDEEPRPPSILNSRVDQDLETICLKALEKETARRYPTAADFADDLERWRRHEPIRVRPVTSTERLQKWARRHPAVAILSAVTMVLVVTLAIGSTVAALSIRERSRELRRNLYVSRMNSGFQALQVGDLRLARADLAACNQPDLRAFEWRYLWGQYQTQEVHTFKEVANYCCAVSPNGRLLASGYKEVHLIDLSTRREVATSSPDKFPTLIMGMAFSPDGRTLASGCFSPQCVALWNVEDLQKPPRVLPMEDHVHGVAFTPDGRWLVAGAGHRYSPGVPGVIRVWDAVDGAVRTNLSGVTESVCRVAVSPDGRWIAGSGANGWLKIWDAGTFAEVASLGGLREFVFGLAFSKDSKRLAAADSEGTVALWNTGSWDMRSTLAAHTRMIHWAEFSPDSRLLATASVDQTVKLWDAESGFLQSTLRGHEGQVTSIAFAMGGALMASSSWDRTIKLWSPTKTAEPLVFGMHRALWDVKAAFAPDGDLLGISTNVLTTHQTGAGQVAYRTALFEVPAVRPERSAPGPTFLGDVSGHPFALGKDGWVVTRTLDHQLTLWKAEAERITERHRLKSPLTLGHSIAIARDGSKVSARTDTNAIVLWTRATPDSPQVIVRPWILSDGNLVFSRDGRQLVLGHSKEGLIEFWDTERLELTGTLSVGHADTQTLALSPDDKILAAQGKNQTLWLWDVASRRALRRLDGTPGWIGSLAFAPDGRTVVAGGHNGGLHVYNLVGGMQVAEIPAHRSTCRAVSFSADGTRLVSAGVDNTIKVWFAPTFDEIDGLAAK